MELQSLKEFKGKTVGDLNRDIIDKGLCTACGTCVAVCNKDVLHMEVEEPIADQEKCISCGICYACCPGQKTGVPELEKELFGTQKNEHADLLGLYRNCYVSKCADEEIMISGASGGTAAALQIYALEKGLIDGVIGVSFDKEKPWVPVPVLSTTKEEVLATQGSKYTHCSVNDLLKETVKKKMRVAVVGLPCVIHGIRKVQHYMPESALAKSIVFTIGLLCAENRFTRGVEHIITKRLGVPLENVARVSYREGLYPGAFTVWDKAGEKYSIPYPDQLTFIWMHTRPRCRICWDYSAELADISLGETQHIDKKMAHNAAMVRTEKGEEIFNAAIAAGYVTADHVDEKMIINHTGLERKKFANLIRIEWYREHGMPLPDYPSENTHYEGLPNFYFGPKR
ncbi:MAG TPA: Coenzyme F420 hydrogenase/dehydrogenase, beta subunit C-terminal domain [Anaerovoracaceae bacterium]|nr:Coenzyme F420 hydrogenase/dehydrogenase, beta subunit C-terminal domain [Anaerovoracaceae bacterium]